MRNTIHKNNCTPVLTVTVACVDSKDHNNVMVRHKEHSEVHLLLNIVEAAQDAKW